MISDSSAKYLWDAHRAARRVVRFTEGRTFAEYHADDLLRSAVERQLSIVGEALAALRRGDPATAATIPDLRRIVAFRNVLVHGYANVDDALVWGIVVEYLPRLLQHLSPLLKGVGGPPSDG